MTYKQFADYIRLKTKTNSTTFPDADIMLYANIVKDDIAKEVNKVNEDYFGIEILRNLAAGKRNYAFPSYVLSQIKYVQAQLDGVKWSKLNEFDINTYERATDEASILANWIGKEPEFDIFGGELKIYSDKAIIDVTGGLKLWAIIYPADITGLTSTTDMSVPPTNITFGMPRQLHKVWATKVIIEYKEAKDRPLPLNEKEQNVSVDLEIAIHSLKDQNLDREFIPTIPYNDGSQF